MLVADMLVAVAIIMIAVLSTLALLARCQRQVAEEAKELSALRLANSQIEILRALPFGELTPRKDASLVEKFPPPRQPKGMEGHLTIEDYEEEESIKKVTVTINWKAGKRERQVKIVTLVSEKGAGKK